MDTADLYSRLTSIFREVFENDALVATPELMARDVEGWDSLNHIRLVLTVQKAFGVKFAAHEIANLQNVGQLAALIQKKKM
jgi:acyl carrier protein